MASKVARGKALMAKLRADTDVKDAQKLAGWIKKRKVAGKLLGKGGDSSAGSVDTKPRSGESKRQGAERVAAEVRRKGNRRAAGRAPDSFRERQSREGSMPGGDTVSKSERNRVSPGNSNSSRWADRVPLKAGMDVQRSRGGAADTGKVLGVTENGRIRVKPDKGGESYVIDRSELLILLTGNNKKAVRKRK